MKLETYASLRLPFRFLRYAVILFSSALFLYLAYLGWRGFEEYEWSVDYSWLAASFLLLSCAFATGALGWKMVLGQLGVGIPFDTAFGVWMTSQLGKYLPVGTAWYIIGRVALAKRVGVGMRESILSTALEMALLVVGGATFYLLSALGQEDARIPGIVFAALLVAGFCAFLWPPLFLTVANFCLTRARQSTISEAVGPRELAGLVVFYVAQWALLGSAFYFLAGSFRSLPLQSWPAVAGAFAVSCVLGYVAVLVPNGIGIREASLVAMLSVYLPVQIALAIAVAARAWYSVTELALAVIVLILRPPVTLAQEGIPKRQSPA